MTEDIDLIRQRLEHLKERIVNHVNAAEAKTNAIKDILAGPMPRMPDRLRPKQTRTWIEVLRGAIK
jgi:hypothetical protein